MAYLPDQWKMNKVHPDYSRLPVSLAKQQNKYYATSPDSLSI